MNRLGRSSRQAIRTSLLLLAIIGWHAQARAGQLTLTWSDSSTSELGFSVERSTGTTGAFAEVTMLGPGATSYVDPSVADATTYCYRVRAFDATAYSDYSNAACGATAPTVGLAVLKIGAGTGTVISAPSGVICGTSCSGTYPSGTAVTLTATPATGSTFTGWSGGGCTGTGSCTVTLTSTTTVTATFDAIQSVSLTVSSAGTGSGTVSSTPAGILCGTTCSASYPYATAVTLTAVVPAGSTFTGWSGACTGTGTCPVTLTSPTTVTATFALKPVTLMVRVRGLGTVTSTPAGINCGTTSCTASYLYGTAVTLTANSNDERYTFTGWSGGGCAGAGSCTVTLSSATRVRATFARHKRQ